MTPRQRVLLTQLQLCGMGVIFLGFGIAWSKTWLIVFGMLIMAYGAVRLLLLKKLMDHNEAEDSSAQNGTENSSPEKVNPAVSISEEEKEDQEGEYAKDEWESKLESYLERHYDRKHRDFYSQALQSESSPVESEEQKTDSALPDEKSGE